MRSLFPGLSSGARQRDSQINPIEITKNWQITHEIAKEIGKDFSIATELERLQARSTGHGLRSKGKSLPQKHSCNWPGDLA